ncbi:transglycosylase SLT domain-containing protein [Ancylobacter pratisalsi]|nr:transglycosylase SLT domain-containing protein [Ancylobacter pratisalsi]
MPPPRPAASETAASARPLGWSSVDRTVPAALLVPVAHIPAGLVAPSYAVWLIDPPHAALPGAKFVARGEALAGSDAFQRVIAVPPPAPTSLAAAPSAVILLSVPLPPKRLAEKRRMVLAFAEPPPPPGLLAPMPALQQAPPAPGEASPDRAIVPPGDIAEQNAEVLGEDAARPIDDAPEPVSGRVTADRAPPQIEALIQRHAERFDVPARLVRRVAWRESKFDPKQRNGPYWGLMQIRVDTARGLGFRGAPKDLLDADTNMSYAVAYLANAYRVAGRDEKRAIMLYARGYYYEAKRKGMLGSLIRTAAAEE